MRLASMGDIGLLDRLDKVFDGDGGEDVPYP